jgi:hypothetical protein
MCRTAKVGKTGVSMSPARYRAILSMAVILAGASAATAQPPAPHIGYIFPAGGREGTTYQATVGGQYFDGVNSVYVSGNGVEATVADYEKPLTPKQINDLRERQQELQKKEKDEAVRKELAEIREKLAKFQTRRANPALADNATLKIVIAEDAEPGNRELRIATPSGLSNPVAIQVGRLPEFSLKKDKVARDPMTGTARGNAGPMAKAPKTEMEVTLPAMLNGQILPGDVDRYRFAARKGQRLVVAACARELMPYLADAVPGWFQAALTLYDANGKELAYDDDFRFHPDPVLYYKIPKDGQYTLEIKDALYRGRDDFVYRVSIGELPFVTGIFPLGGPAGEKIPVAIEGWNLPVSKIMMDTTGKEPGTIPLLVRNKGQISNSMPFAVDTLPECLEQEPNDKPNGAQQISPPTIVNGRINKPGDWDVFRFEGRAGQKIVAEVIARRLDSPLDSLLRLTDDKGRQLAVSDDHEDLGDGLSTHFADSLIALDLPANGAYYLYLGDAQHHGGTAYAYRLRVSEPRPDFQLRMAPSSVNVRAGASAAVTVYALRRDGFAGEIKLNLKDAPKIIALNNAKIPANQDKARFTITVPPVPLDEPFHLVFEGRATIDRREIVRQSVPAEDMMQAFYYRHLVPQQELMLAITGRGRVPLPFRYLGKDAVKLPADGTAQVQFSMPRGPIADQLHLELNEPPEGIAVQKVSPAPPNVTFQLSADGEKVKPGDKGNLIFEAFMERSPNPASGRPQAAKRRVSLGRLPAVPFEIVESPP